MLRLRRAQVEEIFSHALAANPDECCGLVGGTLDNDVTTIYRLRNVAAKRRNAYEAAPEDLFEAQRLMRERNEQLLAIYHSHPRSAEPKPSDTDMRQAFYPNAVYLIVGLSEAQPTMRAFNISERSLTWEPVEYVIADE